MDEHMLTKIKNIHNCEESQNKIFALATGCDGNNYCIYCKRMVDYSSVIGSMTTGEFMGTIQEMLQEKKTESNTVEPLKEGEDIVFEEQDWKEDEIFNIKK